MMPRLEPKKLTPTPRSMTRGPGGELDRTQLRATDTALPGEQWLAVPADVLVPAAASYGIDAGNQHPGGRLGEWVLFGDIDGSAAESFARISARIGALSEQMFEHAERHGISPRAAALAISSEHLDDISRRFPAV
jgi:glutamate dehydrogenase (NAD(P)+)